MDFLGLILIEMLGEVILAPLRRPLAWLRPRLNGWVALLAWAATPIIEWLVFRDNGGNPSTFPFALSVVLALGMPVSALLLTVVAHENRRGHAFTASSRT